MNFRIFSKKYNLYTSSSFWPSNQRTMSEFALSQNGGILEIVKEDENDFVIEHDSRNFVIEPWTGYLDVNGRKIYRGDFLLAENDAAYRAEVIWLEGGFFAKDQTGYKMPLDAENRAWKRHVVSGNIHNVEYED